MRINLQNHLKLKYSNIATGIEIEVISRELLSLGDVLEVLILWSNLYFFFLFANVKVGLGGEERRGEERLLCCVVLLR